MKKTQPAVHAAILAGGFGTRLDAVADPRRNKWPFAKPAAPVGNWRIVDFSLVALARAGLRELNLLTCHLPEGLGALDAVPPHLRSGLLLNEFREDPGDPLDTAGAVGRLAYAHGWDRDPDALVIVPSADIIHNVDFGALLEEHCRNRRDHGAVATIVVNAVPWDDVERFGTVRLDGMPSRTGADAAAFEAAMAEFVAAGQGRSRRILEFREKMPRRPGAGAGPDAAALSNLNNSSIYVFNASLFATLNRMLTRKDSASPLHPELWRPGGPVPFSDWGRHVFNWLVQPAQQAVFPVFAWIMPRAGYWRDAGMGEELRQANLDVVDGRLRTDLSEPHSGWRPAGRNSWLGPGGEVAADAILENAVVGAGVRVGQGALLRRSVVGAGTVVGDNARILESLVFPRHLRNPQPNRIGAGAEVLESLVLGGELEPGARVRRAALFTPVFGLAQGSLLGKTKYLLPGDC